MPHYFIETNDGDSFHRDRDGLDLKDDQAARVQAIAALPDMARDKIPDGDRRRLSVAVRNGDGRLIYRATLTLEGEWCAVDGV